MQYQEAVAEFRSLDESIEAQQWRQAQIVWEQYQTGISSVRMAQDTGKGERHIRALRRTWEIRRSAADMEFASAYRMAETGADTPDEATTLKDAHRASSALGNLPPERKAKVIREALTDPDVARHTFNAPEPDDETTARARMHAGSAISRHDQRIQQHLGEKRHQESETKGRTDQEAMYEVSSMMQVLADVVVTGGKLAHKLSEGATLSSGMQHTLAGYATKAKATIEWLEGIEDQQHAEDVDEVLRVWAAEA